jgi:hypothetical protein
MQRAILDLLDSEIVDGKLIRKEAETNIKSPGTVQSPKIGLPCSTRHAQTG